MSPKEESAVVGSACAGVGGRRRGTEDGRGEICEVTLRYFGLDVLNMLLHLLLHHVEYEAGPELGEAGGSGGVEYARVARSP